jgi:hypothetical protein
MSRKLLPIAVGLALTRVALSQGEPPVADPNAPPVDATVPVT